MGTFKGKKPIENFLLKTLIQGPDRVAQLIRLLSIPMCQGFGFALQWGTYKKQLMNA